MSITDSTTQLRGLALFDAVLDQITAHPETWSQETYRCATGFCFAGWACEITGGTWAADLDSGRAHDVLLAEPGDEPAEVYDIGEGGRITAAQRAARLLDISELQRQELFRYSATLDDIKAVRDELAAQS